MKNKINMFETLENRTLLAGAGEAVKELMLEVNCDFGKMYADTMAGNKQLSPVEAGSIVFNACANNYAAKFEPVQAQLNVAMEAVEELNALIKDAQAGDDEIASAIFQDMQNEMSASLADSKTELIKANKAVASLRAIGSKVQHSVVKPQEPSA